MSELAINKIPGLPNEQSSAQSPKILDSAIVWDREGPVMLDCFLAGSWSDKAVQDPCIPRLATRKSSLPSSAFQLHEACSEHLLQSDDQSFGGQSSVCRHYVLNACESAHVPSLCHSEKLS